MTDERQQLARRAIRGAPQPPSASRLPDARLAERSRRRGARDVATAQPLRHQRRREPRRMDDHDHVAGVPQHACALARPVARSRSTRACPIRSSIASMGSIPNTRRCSPTPSVSRCSSCSRPFRLPSDWHSCCTTCSPCRSMRSRPSSARTPTATRQLASRARRRVQGAAAVPDADVTRQREVVDAFFAAARGGDFDALLALLDPDVVMRADAGPESSIVVRGAAAVAGRALMFARPTAQRTTRARERRRRRGRDGRRSSRRGDGLHRERTQDHRDRLTRRPRSPRHRSHVLKPAGPRLRCLPTTRTTP